MSHWATTIVLLVNRRIATLLVALGPLLGLGIAGSVATVPYVALGPGPTFNTIGTVDDNGQVKQVVAIEGAQTEPVSGNLNMTTVSVRDKLTIFQAFGLWLSSDHGIVPRAEVYPPDRSRQDVDKDNAADFAKSENSAEIAALRYLKYPITVVAVGVGEVGDKSPAKGILNEGDQLLSVDGVPVKTAKGVQEQVSAHKPGTELPIEVRRDGKQQNVKVKLGERPDDKSKGFLGITPEEQDKAEVPFKVHFNLTDIGGPSAGLMFSLAVVDKLSPGELSGGTFIAGTGTIDDQGKVGPIGGITYKMIAARQAGAITFLVPADNCSEAREHIPAGLRLVKVDTLPGAVSALESLSTGGPAPTCDAK
ncbi:MAG: PDZ domain-containing protein [Mycobacteriaceae bacterium]|nr:PDZ domain-containing protein [Mycobacteriaceae bacterium]